MINKNFINSNKTARCSFHNYNKLYTGSLSSYVILYFTIVPYMLFHIPNSKHIDSKKILTNQKTKRLLKKP